MRWFFKCLKQYADFKGRARRKEYWMFGVFLFLVVFTLAFPLVSLIDYLFAQSLIGQEDMERIWDILGWVIYLPLLLPSMAVTARRLQDVGYNGWPLTLSVFGLHYLDMFMSSLIISILAVILALICLYLCLQDSQPGTNKYGPNPKGVEAT